MRRVSGYNLDEFVKDQPFPSGSARSGFRGHAGCHHRSQGEDHAATQGDRALDVVQLGLPLAAVEASPEILAFRPAAMELMDKTDSGPRA